MEKICYVEIPVNRPLTYDRTGTFVAPSGDWMHDNLPLNDFELIVMTSGSLYLEYHDERYTVGKGEFLLLPPYPEPNNNRRGFQRSGCSFYWLHFMPAEPFRLLSCAPSSGNAAASGESLCLPISDKIPNFDKMAVLLRQLQDNVQLGFQTVTLNYQTTSILCDLASQFSQTERRENTSNYQKQIYADIVDYVKLNTSIMLTVSDVAARFGYNEKYLSHLFNSLSGMPLKQYINKCKMEDANYMLIETNLSIGEISSRLGYKDPHNFTRAYKNYNGMSPSAYRETYAEKLLYHI